MNFDTYIVDFFVGDIYHFLKHFFCFSLIFMKISGIYFLSGFFSAALRQSLKENFRMGHKDLMEELIIKKTRMILVSILSRQEVKTKEKETILKMILGAEHELQIKCSIIFTFSLFFLSVYPCSRFLTFNINSRFFPQFPCLNMIDLRNLKPCMKLFLYECIIFNEL